MADFQSLNKGKTIIIFLSSNLILVINFFLIFPKIFLTTKHLHY